MALNFASIMMERSATAMGSAVTNAYSAASRGIEQFGAGRQSEDGRGGLLASQSEVASREPSCSGGADWLLEGTCFRETASEPGLAKSRLAVLGRDRFGTYDKDVVSAKPKKKLHKTWLFGKHTRLDDVHQCTFSTKGVSNRKQDLSLWAFTLSNPSDKRSYQHTAVTIGFTDKLTADRWHAKATEALLVHQQRDRPDLSAQSMTLPTRPSKDHSIDILGGEDMSDIPIMDASKSVTGKQPGRALKIDASSRSHGDMDPPTPTFVQFATPFGSPVQQSRSNTPRSSWYGGKGEGGTRLHMSISESGEPSGGNWRQAWRRVVAIVTCSRF